MPNATITEHNDTRPRQRRALDQARATGGRRDVRLSILMPVYNEEATLKAAIDSVLRAWFPCPIDLIVVDDGSTDRTPMILSSYDDPRVRVLRQPRNLGKGAALRAAIAQATGTHVVPFDADLEYAAEDLVRMLEPVLAGRCDVVYGTRLFGVNTVYQSYRHALGNRVMTTVANLLYDAYLSDMHTCLKLVSLSLLEELDLRESGFGLDTEITAKLLRRGLRPFEVPVSYHSRSIAAGKKITYRDGLECIRVLGRVRFRTAPTRAVPGAPPVGPHVDEDALRVLGDELEARAHPQDAAVLSAIAGG